MSELAFNSNGESFDLPATVTGWRVRRLKPRGAPELVYGKDGRPLTITIEADIDELRNAVVTPGRYRLDAINDDGKSVENVPAAYVQVVRLEREPAAAVSTMSSTSDDILREAMRFNTELAKSVIDQFPAMMMSAAELLRAADGAGLPARQPRGTAMNTDDDDDETEDDDLVTPASGSPLLEMINQFAPVIIATLAPKLGSLFEGGQKAVTEEATKESAVPRKAIAKTSATNTAPAPSKAIDLSSIDPATLAKIMAVQAQLTPAELARVQRLGAQLSPTEVSAFFDELAAMPMNDAVAKVRSMIGGAESAS
jgi:hypothetical protein